MTLTGTVAWFHLTKQLGFVALESGHGDAFLHMSVLKEAVYVVLPRGTTVRVTVEQDRSKQRVAEVLKIDTIAARPGENEALRHKPKA